MRVTVTTFSLDQSYVYRENPLRDVQGRSKEQKAIVSKMETEICLKKPH